VALLLAATLVVGDEFRYGTLRTSLLAAGDRRRFLLARLISILVMALGLFGLLLVVALVLSLGLAVVGAELPTVVGPVHAGPAIAFIAVQVLVVLVASSVGIALTVLLRSGALPLLLIILGTFLELFLAALPIFQPGELLAAVPQLFLSTNVRTLLTRLGPDTGAVALADIGQPPPTVLDLGIPILVGIVAAWGVLFVLLADRRLRTMDVTE
jgi:ABC-type transport system involved in multi-copper enzyme maturation permease subunit